MMEPEDNALSQELLLEHAVWLRRLARELVRDPGAADDLVQDTWLAALLARPDLGLPLRPWLARVMRNGATQRLRRAAGRAARESEVARPEAMPSARELVERAEQQRVLVDAVLSLQEPYRQTMLLRFYEGLGPAQIATALGVPAVTVRTHLHRGLQKLREKLDRESGGDRKAWMLMLQPLAGPSGLPVSVLAFATVMLVVAGVWVGSWWSAGASRPSGPGLAPGETVAEAVAGGVEVPGPTPSRTPGALGAVAGASQRRLQLVNERSGAPLPEYMVRVLGEEFTSDGEGWVSIPAAARTLVPVDDPRLRTLSFTNHQEVVSHKLRAHGVGIPEGEEAAILQLVVGPTYRLNVESSVVVEAADLQATLQVDGSAGSHGDDLQAPVRPSVGLPWVRFAKIPDGALGSDSRWKLVVRHVSGLWFGEAPVQDVRAGEAEPLRMALRGMAVLQGQITGAPPGTNLQVILKPIDDAGQMLEEGMRWITPDEEGRYSLQFVTPGQYRMQVTSPLHEIWSTRVQLFAAARCVQDVALDSVTTAGSLAGIVRSQSGTYSGQLLVFLRDQNQRLVDVYPTTWIPSAERGSTATFEFATVPTGPLSLDVVSLSDEVTFDVQPVLLQGPNDGVEVVLLDRLEACDWGFLVVREDTGAALQEFLVRVRVEGAFERSFKARLIPDEGGGDPVWNWTRIVGHLQWNEFKGRAALLGLPVGARFTWRVEAEGFAMASGDQTSFATVGDGKRSTGVRLVPLATHSD